MPRPWSSPRRSRPRCALDAWVGPGWTLLEHHALDVAAPPATALESLAALRIRELPAVRALFALRRLRHSGHQTLREFFSTPPFVLLDDDPGRELVFGVLRPARGPEDGEHAGDAPADAFARALRAAPFAAIGTFRAEPRADGSTLWTETWARTRGRRAAVAFGIYWLVIGPWSAWIRRMFLRAARRHAERPDAKAEGRSSRA